MIHILVLVCSSAALLAQAATDVKLLEQPEWRAVFEQYQAEGTLVVLDHRQPSPVYQVHNLRRAVKPYLPASTYKIPHALIALEQGVVKDEFQIFTWDRKQQEFDAWNSDQNLRSSMRGSVVWVYQNFARQLDEGTVRQYLQQSGYGNAEPTGGRDGYWLDGHIRINALEQIAFLKKLHDNRLPFKVEHQRLVKDILIVEAGKDWILRAKTGWEGSFGWWVGYVEWPTGPVFFALNMDTPNRVKDLYKREAIGRAVLQSVKALPAP